MSTAQVSDWSLANQRYLMAALGVVGEAIERARSARTQGEPPPATASETLRQAADAMPAPPALELLTRALALTPFERDVILLAAGPELDASFSARLATDGADGRRAQPTFGLALAVLPDAHWSALLPGGPLRRFRLVELGAGDSLVASPLRIDERVLHFIAGLACFDERLAPLLSPAEPARSLPPTQRAIAERLVSLLSARSEKPPLLLVAGDLGASRSLAATAYAELGLAAFALRAVDVPAGIAEREQLARLCEREAALTGLGLILELEEHDSPESARVALHFAEGLAAPLVLACRDAVPARRRPVLRLDVPRPSASERDALWRSALGPAAEGLNGALAPVVAEFELQPSAIFAASADALSVPPGTTIRELPRRLWDACRAQARPRLDELAQRIEPVAGLGDLVLPPTELERLRALLTQVRQRGKVHDSWGFAGKSSRGLGISALFAGQSGTGKTMAAEALASELRLDLYRVDLSGVVSKYIGETEKNLRRIFDAAETGGVILLFDEADALFGKRSEVKDSHDRYANIEVSYLLQRMEAYRGLAVLTSNLKHALDTAFLRRLRFVVDFPFPDAASRAELWRRAFPAAAPTEGLDPVRLAQLNVPGGNIRNIALSSAFFAADAGEPVRMLHVLAAARSEYAKLERSLTEIEIRGWS